ncbi:11-S seed storage protein plant protein [Dioscorea alata]|uniref:11-S seed storage protein plant protein n=1 Tax=Dioscorea alata TaxID=55571 RepID=A0ACB7WS31_DIOAL|nr:11-S seed storage protein plant protein [Dioscorea alata]
MAIKCCAFLFLALLLVTCSASRYESQQEQQEQQELSAARQCRLQQLSPSRPSKRIEAEGGVTEFWDQTEDQLQCAGVSVRRHIIRPRSLLLPLYENTHGLLYIQQGRGFVGVSFPGCPESFHSSVSSPRPFEEGSSEQAQFQTDSHQKVHRVRQGDTVAIVAGATHWCYNDGDQDLVAVTVFNVNHQDNQLDPSVRMFLLAGQFLEQQSSYSRQESEREQETESSSRESVVSAFDPKLMSEILSIPEETVRQMQRNEKKGHMVTIEQGLSFVRPAEQQEQEECMDEARPSSKESQFANGLEEAYCYARIQHNLDTPEETDIYSRKAGRFTSVNSNKLPILSTIGMSMDKINLRPDAIFAPHYTVNAHSIMFVTRGEGQVQVVDNKGRNLFNGRVRQGDLIVVPQFYVTVKKAGRDGFEFVAFKTAPIPVRSPLFGHMSLFSGVPAQVIASSYRISVGQARQLKQCRQQHFMLFPPSSSSSSSSYDADVASA